VCVRARDYTVVSENDILIGNTRKRVALVFDDVFQILYPYIIV